MMCLTVSFSANNPCQYTYAMNYEVRSLDSKVGVDFDSAHLKWLSGFSPSSVLKSAQVMYMKLHGFHLTELMCVMDLRY